MAEILKNNTVAAFGSLGQGKAQADLLNLTFGVIEEGGVKQYLMPNVNGLSLEIPQETYKIRGDSKTVEVWSKGPSEGTGSLSLTALTQAFEEKILGHNTNADTGGVGPGSTSVTPEVSATVDMRDGEGTLTVFGVVAIKCQTPSISMDRSGEGLTHDNVSVPFEARSVAALETEHIYLKRTGLTDAQAAQFRAYIHNFRLAETAELEADQLAAELANVGDND